MSKLVDIVGSFMVLQPVAEQTNIAAQPRRLMRRQQLVENEKAVRSELEDDIGGLFYGGGGG